MVNVPLFLLNAVVTPSVPPDPPGFELFIIMLLRRSKVDDVSANNPELPKETLLLDASRRMVL